MENEEAGPLVYILAPAGIENQTDLTAYQVNGAEAPFRQAVVDRVAVHVIRLKNARTHKVNSVALVGNPSAKVWPMAGVIRTIFVEALYLYQCIPDGEDKFTWLRAALIEQFSTHTEVIVKRYPDGNGGHTVERGMVDDGVLKRTFVQVTEAIEFAESAERAHRDGVLVVPTRPVPEVSVRKVGPKKTSNPRRSAGKSAAHSGHRPTHVKVEAVASAS